MDLTHQFTVPTSVDATWAHFNDIAAVAECFPGAVVTEATPEEFSGSVKVKLGPIALQYNGTGTFVEKDEAAKRFVVDAKGKDKRGNGTAGATVTVSMTAAEDSSTAVEVLTDLTVTGKPAQFGRGVMQDVSDKLLGKFVECLEQRLSGNTPEAAAPETTSDSAPPPGADAAATTSTGQSATTTTQASAPRPVSAPANDEALDLGSAVLPVLAKTYGKYVAGAGLVALLLALLIRRRRK